MVKGLSVFQDWFVLDGSQNKYGLPSWVGEDRLIPLKAIAWMEMPQRLLARISAAFGLVPSELTEFFGRLGLYTESLLVSGLWF